MQTPATVWHRSERRYDPHPARWEYPAGAKVLKVGSRGTLDAFGVRWKIAKALIGERVQLERVGQRVLVYYYRTLIRELNLQSQSSIAVQRWRPQSGSDTDAAFLVESCLSRRVPAPIFQSHFFLAGSNTGAERELGQGRAIGARSSERSADP